MSGGEIELKSSESEGGGGGGAAAKGHADRNSVRGGVTVKGVSLKRHKTHSYSAHCQGAHTHTHTGIATLMSHFALISLMFMPRKGK